MLAVDKDYPPQQLRLVGIDEVGAPRFSLSPNPASETLTIEGNSEITIIDIQGRDVIRKEVKGRADIDISGLPKGVYMVRDNKGLLSHKVEDSR